MIYIVEDDDSIRELVSYTLENTGFRAEGFPDGTGLWKALDTADAELPSLILLDIMLPGEDGVAILRKLRADHVSAGIPVIMVTAKGSEYDKVNALDLGADDYVTKPFGMMELVSRIRAVLRRSGRSAESGDVLTCNGISLDQKRHEVYVKGGRIDLTLKEYELLRLLMSNLEVVMTRDRILEKVWGYSFDGETRTVDVHMRTLRSKLGEAGDCLETVRGVGYRMRNGAQR
ncbi:MAG: response regulator transcription factor [Firmicutes bacterium]|nr:response regulator transcription factor [Bacillota bacterium]